MVEHKITIEELRYRQSLPLQDKIDMSCEKIEQWYAHWDGQVYIAFSGGKDSTVLLDIVRNKALIPDAKDVPAVFSDTGLEYPEIRDFVRTIDNVVWVRPKMSFYEVIQKYGYPVISKEQSDYIGDCQRTKSEKFRQQRLNGNKDGKFKISEKWKFLVDAPFLISERCCDFLKKQPSHIYEKETGRKGMLGTMAEESRLRMSDYLKYGCNGFDRAVPLSRPMSFWTEKDIWDYINKYNLPYSKIYDMGYDRTGCMFCMYGVQSEKEPNKFQKMEKTHPKMYDYCINKLGLGEVMDYIGINYKNEDS